MAPTPSSGLYKTRINPPSSECCVCSVWVSSRGVFLLLDSAHLSHRRPAFCSSSPPTRPQRIVSCSLSPPTRPRRIASCLVPPTDPPSPSGLLPSPLKLPLFGTGSPHVRLWPEKCGYCRVPHHGASPPPKRPGTESITSTPSLPGCKSPFHWGFFFCVCV